MTMNTTEIKMTSTMMKNPLRVGKYRNKECLCGSKKKVKHCCGAHIEVPTNLGQFWIHVIAGDKVRAQFFAEAWQDDMKAANKMIEENKKNQITE